MKVQKGDSDLYMEAMGKVIKFPFLVLRRDFSVKFANPSFYRTFLIAPEESEKYFYEIENGRWNIPDLISLLGKVFPINV